MRYKGIAEGPK